MPAKLLLPLRYLQPSFPVARFSTMKPVKTSRVLPVFSRVFPHKLKYQSFGSLNLASNGNNSKQQELKNQFSSNAIRKLSSRSGGEVRASRSLIDDEAELSDWVSGLSSKKTRLYSDSEKDDDESGSVGFGKGRGSGREERGGKRRRESGFGEFDGSSRRGGTRSSTERFPRRGENAGDTAERFPRRRENAGDTAERFPRRRENAGDTTERFPRRRGNAGDTTERFPRRRGNAGDTTERFPRKRENAGDTTERFPRRGGYAGDNVSSRRESGFDDFNGSSRRRGARDSVERFPGRGRENGGGNVSSRRKGMDLNERYSGGSRGKGTFGGEVEGRREKKRGVRDSGSHFEMDRDGGRGIRRGEKGERRGSLVMSEEDDVDEEEDEDEVDKGYRSFKELIGSDEGSEEVDDDEDEDEDEEEDDEQGGDVFNRESVLAQRVSEDAGRGSSPDSPGSSHSYLSETRFDQFSISSLSMKGLKDAGYEKMTVVQEATLPVILKGKDVMAKARTGTGKTVAFLLPSIEGVVKAPPASHDQKRPPILVLVVCPTRELACQAAQEANKLLKYHTSIGVQVVIGGTRLALEQKRMQANPCQILVATPGRLRDHIENTAGFATRLMGVKVLVLDEADHLLDMGFRKDIEKIIAAVPKQRQTLLFSATIPQEVRQICHIALKRDHEYINTVQEGTEETHAQVRQMHLVAPLDNHFPVLCSLLKEHIADNVDYKVLVFCTTAMVTRLVAELLGELNLNVREIHSRKSQSYRTKVSDEFRKSKGLILVTSDVSARGVDYPDVTLVIQIGLPADRQQYIHRLGRTGRKGKEGQGMLLLAPWEEFFLSTIKDLPVSKAPAPLVDPDTRKKVERALSLVGMKDKESAYQAWLGYYNSNKTIGRDKYRLVELANEFSRTMGLDNPPAISKLVLGKMGLRNIPGLRSK